MSVKIIKLILSIISSFSFFKKIFRILKQQSDGFSESVLDPVLVRLFKIEMKNNFIIMFRKVFNLLYN